MSLFFRLMQAARELPPDHQRRVLNYIELLQATQQELDDAPPPHVTAAGHPAPQDCPAGGWYEARYITKKSKAGTAKKYGPYRYYCWNEGRRRRAKYIGKW